MHVNKLRNFLLKFQLFCLSFISPMFHKWKHLHLFRLWCKDKTVLCFFSILSTAKYFLPSFYSVYYNTQLNIFLSSFYLVFSTKIFTFYLFFYLVYNTQHWSIFDLFRLKHTTLVSLIFSSIIHNTGLSLIYFVYNTQHWSIFDLFRLYCRDYYCSFYLFFCLVYNTDKLCSIFSLIYFVYITQMNTVLSVIYFTYFALIKTVLSLIRFVYILQIITVLSVFYFVYKTWVEYWISFSSNFLNFSANVYSNILFKEMYFFK